MATASQIAEFRSASDELTRLALDDLADVFWPLAQGGSPDAVRNSLLQVTPDLVSTYGDLASVLGADWYDTLRVEAVGKPAAVLGSTPNAEQVQASTRAVIGPLWESRPDDAWSNLSGAVQRLLMESLRGSIDASARADAMSGRVAAVGWARHTRPAMAKSGKSCEFCTMLAGRGPVYKSAASAGATVGRGSTRTGLDESGARLSGGIGGGVKARGSQELASRYHDNCHCVAEPTFYEVQERPVTVRGFTNPTKVLVPILMGLAA